MGADGHVPRPLRELMRIERDFERHSRERLEKTRHERREQDAAVGGIGDHAQRPPIGRLQSRDRAARGVGFLTHAPGMRIEQTSRRGQREATRGALEHAHPECLLEIRDRATDCSLRHPERPGRGREAVEIHNLRQHGELGRCPDQVHGGLNTPG